MSNFYDLATKLQEDGGGVTGPTSGGATTMDAISYLPAQVGVVRAALTGLGKKKKKWNMEVLEGESGRTIRFEDALQITVPNEHWNTFQEMFDGQLGSDSCFELPSSIMDSENELDVEGEKAVIHLAVESFCRCPQVIKLQEIYKRWTSRMGGKSIASPNILLSVENLEESIESVYEALIKGIETDRGRLEILSERVEEDPLPDLKKTRECHSLAGFRIHSVFEGVGLIFEARLRFDKTFSFSVLVQDGDAADKLEESLSPSVQRVENVFYPGVRDFGRSQSIPDLLVETIRDLKGEEHGQTL